MSYLRTRWLTPRIGLLAGLTAGLASLTGPQPWQGHALLVVALVFGLRLLDDLLDWRFDCQHHPERALCRVKTGQRNALLMATLFALAALAAFHAMLFGSPLGATVFSVGLGLAYAPGLSRSSREMALLAKYPGLVLIGAVNFCLALVLAGLLYAVLLALNAKEHRAQERHAQLRNDPRHPAESS
jgi:hypothetical protein